MVDIKAVEAAGATLVHGVEHAIESHPDAAKAIIAAHTVATNTAGHNAAKLAQTAISVEVGSKVMGHAPAATGFVGKVTTAAGNVLKKVPKVSLPHAPSAAGVTHAVTGAAHSAVAAGAAATAHVAPALAGISPVGAAIGGTVLAGAAVTKLIQKRAAAKLAKAVEVIIK